MLRIAQIGIGHDHASGILKELKKQKDIFEIAGIYLPEEEKAKLQGLPTCLEDALDALEKDHDYLTAGEVFPEELIKKFIAVKREECRQISAIPHPVEFEKYYNS